MLDFILKQLQNHNNNSMEKRSTLTKITNKKNQADNPFYNMNKGNSDYLQKIIHLPPILYACVTRL